MRIYLFIFAALISNLVNAVEASPKSTINRLISYAQFGNGDIFTSLDTNGVICTYGYYINKDSIGYDANLSMLLAAYHAKTPIIIRAHQNKKWPGSSNYVCEIYAVEYKE